MTPKDPQVSGWRPDFLPAEEQLALHAARLRCLVGLRIEQTWTVWDLEHDEWFADLPVVLRFEDGPQLEVCWEKFDDLSITWDTIDLAVTPKAWVEWPLQWRQAAHPALAAAAGAELEQITVTTFRFVTENLGQPHDTRAAWLTSGLWFGTDGSGLHVFNALDENGLDQAPPPRDADHDWRPV